MAASSFGIPIPSASQYGLDPSVIVASYLVAPLAIGSTLSDAFDLAIARAERCRPAPSGERQQVVPCFDYDPDAFYPLLDDERLLGVFETLLGDDFILCATEGIIHAGGTPWHRDACAPEGMCSMRAAIYLDPLGAHDGCRSVIPGSHFPFREALETSVEELVFAELFKL